MHCTRLMTETSISRSAIENHRLGTMEYYMIHPYIYTSILIFTCLFTYPTYATVVDSKYHLHPPYNNERPVHLAPHTSPTTRSANQGMKKIQLLVMVSHNREARRGGCSKIAVANPKSEIRANHNKKNKTLINSQRIAMVVHALDIITYFNQLLLPD